MKRTIAHAYMMDCGNGLSYAMLVYKSGAVKYYACSSLWANKMWFMVEITGA